MADENQGESKKTIGALFAKYLKREEVDLGDKKYFVGNINGVLKGRSSAHGNDAESIGLETIGNLTFLSDKSTELVPQDELDSLDASSLQALAKGIIHVSGLSPASDDSIASLGQLVIEKRKVSREASSAAVSAIQRALQDAEDSRNKWLNVLSPQSELTKSVLKQISGMDELVNSHMPKLVNNPTLASLEGTYSWHHEKTASSRLADSIKELELETPIIPASLDYGKKITEAFNADDTPLSRAAEAGEKTAERLDDVINALVDLGGTLASVASSVNEAVPLWIKANEDSRIDNDRSLAQAAEGLDLTKQSVDLSVKSLKSSTTSIWATVAVTICVGIISPLMSLLSPDDAAIRDSQTHELLKSQIQELKQSRDQMAELLVQQREQAIVLQDSLRELIEQGAKPPEEESPDAVTP